MGLWKIFLILGFVFLILEMLAPLTFFLSLAIGAFVTSIFAIFFNTYSILIPIFVVSSLGSLLLFRPFLRKNLKNGEASGIKQKYIGNVAKVTEKITKYSGTIAIYGERWEARIDDGEEIEKDSEVKIVRNDSLIMYVEKI